MKRQAVLTAIIAGQALAQTSAIAATGMRWQDYDQPGYKLTQARLYAAAELAITNKLQQLNTTGKADDKAILSYLEKLITVCASQNKYNDAQEYCRLAIRFSERDHNHQRTAMLYTALANCQLKLNKLTQADLSLQKGKELLDQDKTASADQRALLLASAGAVEAAKGNFSKAAGLYESALGMEKRTAAGVSPATLTRYAQCLQNQGQVDQAKAALEQAFKLDSEQLGQEHPALAASLNNLAYLNTGCNQLETAEIQMSKALSICRHWHYVDLADWIDNMAFVLEQEHKTEQADSLRQEAISLRTRQPAVPKSLPSEQALHSPQLELHKNSAAAGRTKLF